MYNITKEKSCEGDIMGKSIYEVISDKIADYFPEPEEYYNCPFSIEELRDCIIMFILKDAYDKTEETYSLRENRKNDDDAERMREVRNYAYVRNHMQWRYDRIKKDMNIEVEELCTVDLTTIDKKLEGHQLTKMRYFELKTIEGIAIFKAIVDKRICNVKKISNAYFREYMEEYEKLVESLLKKLDGSDEDVIFGAIALFTLEWSFNIELFYSCTIEAENVGTKEVPKQRLIDLCGIVQVLFEEDEVCVHAESRFILHRGKLVSVMYSYGEQEWQEKVKSKIVNYLGVKYRIEHSTYLKWDMKEAFLNFTTRKQWADFFREHYDLRNIYTKKEWTNERIRYMRKIYDCYMELDPKKKS